ncbi:MULTISPECIES: uracil-DNA glycosylase [Paenibacillus]|uniref:uracil-DNA glycosylase n=1 Tax=Paenibacillus TaxID=44249 RepID=UPI0022B88FD0|nr:uracil-DNA glycosylase [Paenibacillus caseinilyticus]MCZ8522136.1 uracil-DNA glycosylase [Paenibacillus caseinilyticus]
MNSWTPSILPEEEAPAGAKDCAGCELAQQRTRVVWGEGNPDAPLFILLDNPGAREDREGEAFLCGTRETLQEGLAAAGIPREAFFVSYLLKCRPLRAYDKEAARHACRPHLELQLDEKQPRILLALGNVAVQGWFGDPEADVKSLRGRWHQVRGIWTAAGYHPLAVRRRPVLKRLLAEDLERVAAKLKEL